MQNSAFTPASLNALTGTTITWSNDDSQIHSVTAADGSFDSGDMQPGANFSYIFIQPGPHTYFCKYHNGNMSGVVNTTGVR